MKKEKMGLWFPLTPFTIRKRKIIKKYLLWEDQNESLWTTKKKNGKNYWVKNKDIKEISSGTFCLYCGEEPIDVYKLREIELEKEHIIPKSKWTDNTMDNLVLSCKSCNNQKNNLLPYDFFIKYKTKREQKEFENKVKKLWKKRRPQKYRYLTLGKERNWQEELEGFISRNIYIAKMLIDCVNFELNKDKEKTKVRGISGSATYYLRKKIFDISSPFHYKEQLRNLTPYHHAIDAITLAHFKSESYIRLLQDLTKINRIKVELKKRNLTQKKFDSCCEEIFNKWKKPEEDLREWGLLDKYTRNAIKILEKTKQKEIINSTFFPIPHLKTIVEKRIPIQWKKLSRDPFWDGEKEKKIKQTVVEIEKVLTEEEYHERIKNNLTDKRGEIHYPYISYFSDHKVKEDFIASDNPGKMGSGTQKDEKGEKQGLLFKICKHLREDKEVKIELPSNISLNELVEKIGELQKLNSEYGKKYNFLVVKNKNKQNDYTIWDTSKYAGFGIKSNNKAEKVSNFELIQRKRNKERKWLRKNYEYFVRPREIFTLTDKENLDKDLKRLVNLPLFYTGFDHDNVSPLEVAGATGENNKKKEKSEHHKHFNDKIIRTKSVVNFLGLKKKAFNRISPVIKLLKIDILGRRRK